MTKEEMQRIYELLEACQGSNISRNAKVSEQIHNEIMWAKILISRELERDE